MVELTSTNKASSSKPEPTAEELATLEELLSTGKRHFVCQEPQAAIDCFVELCSLLATFYGETADECAEAYLYYGKCLLELARLENGVLGHAIKETPVLGEDGEDSETAKTEEDDEEITTEKRVELIANVQNAMREGNLYNDTTTEDECTEDEADKDAKGTDSKDVPMNQDANADADVAKKDVDADVKKNVDVDAKKDTGADAKKDIDVAKKDIDVAKKDVDVAKKDADVAKKDADVPMKQDNAADDVAAVGTAGVAADDVVDDVADDVADDDNMGEATDIEDEDDVSNMQLSWEMFELTVFICSRQIKRGVKDVKVKSNLAEAKYGLAQISLESEHYEEAVKDFTECLQYYNDFLEDKHDRRLAEVNYNIGLALSFDKKFEESIVQFKLAMSILNSRIADLEGKVKEAEEKGGKGKASTELEEWTKEINELKDLIVLDMVAKIDDSEEMKKEAEKSVQAMKDAAKELFSAVGTSGGFDQGFDGGFDAPSDEKKEIIHDCTSKIRSKRKIEDDNTIESKKVKHMNGDHEPAKHTNGDVNGNSQNGDHQQTKLTNGDHAKMNGSVTATS